MKILLLAASLCPIAISACDDDAGAARDAAVADAADALFVPIEDAGADGAPRFAPEVHIDRELPVVGGLVVQTREMSNAEARAIGVAVAEDAADDLPVLVDPNAAAVAANALSELQGLPSCYATPDAAEPLADAACEGWRIMRGEELVILLANHGDAPVDGDCDPLLDSWNVCYKCTCPNGIGTVGQSVPNDFGIQDLIGNAYEIAQYDDEAVVTGTDYRDIALLIGFVDHSRPRRQVGIGALGAIRLVRTQPIPPPPVDAGVGDVAP